MFAKTATVLIGLMLAAINFTRQVTVTMGFVKAQTANQVRS